MIVAENTKVIEFKTGGKYLLILDPADLAHRDFEKLFLEMESSGNAPDVYFLYALPEKQISVEGEESILRWLADKKEGR